MEFLRGVLGLLGIGCAYMTGRAFIAVRKGWQKTSRLYAWIIRSLLCLVAVAFRFPLDFVDMMVWALALVAFSSAMWSTSREKPHEDLTSTIFPE
ncbi:MAG TPA: hypothetical protein VHW09_03075 [Bryobacteraceae bacterium]|jgi:hypothetical protein|nr:hypothetical protein [Bryobacteraceae bacterium]